MFHYTPEFIFEGNIGKHRDNSLAKINYLLNSVFKYTVLLEEGHLPFILIAPPYIWITYIFKFNYNEMEMKMEVRKLIHIYITHIHI